MKLRVHVHVHARPPSHSPSLPLSHTHTHANSPEEVPPRWMQLDDAVRLLSDSSSKAMMSARVSGDDVVSTNSYNTGVERAVDTAFELLAELDHDDRCLLDVLCVLGECE